MYCRKCGKKIKDDKQFCDYCGQGKEDIVLTGDEKKDAVAQTDYASIGALCIVISFFFPVISLIMSIIYLCTMKNNKTMGNKEIGKRRFITSIIISAGWFVIPMLIGIICMIGALFK